MSYDVDENTICEIELCTPFLNFRSKEDILARYKEKTDVNVLLC